MTLPDDIQALVQQIQQVINSHGLKRIQLGIYSGEARAGAAHLSLHIEHPLGDVLGTEQYLTYFNLNANSRAEKINERVSDGVKKLVSTWTQSAEDEELTRITAEKKLAECQANVEAAAMLDPGVLDQIVIALT